MAVPHHTHTFEIPTATKQDMAARAATDKAVTPSVLGTAATADVSQFATAEQGKKADSAVQPDSLSNLAYKDKITVNEINTNGAPSNTTFLSGNGWQNLTGGGDMTVAIYDPQNKRTDAFNMANMKEADNAKIMTADERLKLEQLKTDLTTADIVETEARKIMTADERNKIAGLDNNYVPKSGGTFTGLLKANGGVDADSLVIQGKARLWETGDITGSLWEKGNLFRHIDTRCEGYADSRRNQSVTSSRFVGWVQLDAIFNNWAHMPSGYVMCDLYQPSGGGAQLHFGGRQPQLYIANIGWFALGGW